MGCFRGRGDTANSMAGCALANGCRNVLMKELLRGVAHGSRLDTFLSYTDRLPRRGGSLISVERARAGWVRGLLHALRAGRVVAVVDVKSLALQDEGSDAVLPGASQSVCLPWVGGYEGVPGRRRSSPTPGWSCWRFCGHGDRGTGSQQAPRPDAMLKPSPDFLAAAATARRPGPGRSDHAQGFRRQAR